MLKHFSISGTSQIPLHCPQYHMKPLSSPWETSPAPQLCSTALPDVAQYRQHPEPTYRVKDKQEILMKMAVGAQVY